MKYFLLAVLVFCSSLAFAQYGMFTMAGDSLQGFAGDNNTATNAQLNWPDGVAVDKFGNVYIADELNNRIRKVIFSSGIITTIAGSGKPGFLGDNGPATAAKLAAPTGVAVDTIGNIYIADYGNNRIRKININGIILTLAGDSLQGFAGDNGAATAAELNTPTNLAVDDSGNVFIADYYNQRIRKVNTAGIITTIAGNGSYGFAGDGGAATSAILGHPTGVAVDKVGNVYMADGNNCIRMINTSGIISTIVGNDTAGFSGDNGPATAAELNNPSGVAVDYQGNVYISDYGNERIRVVSFGRITTIAGNGVKGFLDNNLDAQAGELNSPMAITIDNTNFMIYVADQENNRIRGLWIIEGINEISNNNEVRLYPNPSNSIFNIALQNLAEKYIVIIYNMLGQEVYASPINSSISQIDLTTSPSGLYLYRVTDQDGKVLGSGKLVKE